MSIYLCKFCGETNKDKMASRGHGKRYLGVCRKCQNEYTAYRLRENKKRALEYKGGKCIRCGYNKCYGALDFHHKNPKEKDINFKKIKCRKNFEEIKQELDKCILLCANCHREEHYNKNNITNSIINQRKMEPDNTEF